MESRLKVEVEHVQTFDCRHKLVNQVTGRKYKAFSTEFKINTWNILLIMGRVINLHQQGETLPINGFLRSTGVGFLVMKLIILLLAFNSISIV